MVEDPLVEVKMLRLVLGLRSSGVLLLVFPAPPCALPDGASVGPGDWPRGAAGLP